MQKHAKKPEMDLSLEGVEFFSFLFWPLHLTRAKETAGGGPA